MENNNTDVTDPPLLTSSPTPTGRPDMMADKSKSVTISLPDGDVTGTKTMTGKHETDISPAKEDAVDEEKRRRLDVMRQDLRRMKEKEDMQRERVRTERKEKAKKAADKLKKDRASKGITINPEAMESKQRIGYIIHEDEKIAAWESAKRVQSETAVMKADIDLKLGLTDVPKGEELVQLASDFYSSKHLANDILPEHIRSQLTTQEINDFKLVFDMFDRRGKGYITAHDLERVAGLLGYTSKKKVFKDMIKSTSVDKRGRVSFLNFLDLVLRLQGDGPDPYEDIQRAFRHLDRGAKGYVTMSDLRLASDELSLALSNSAMREMISEADRTGDGHISLDEFSEIIRQTAMFKFAS